MNPIVRHTPRVSALVEIPEKQKYHLFTSADLFQWSKLLIVWLLDVTHEQQQK